MAHKRLMTCSLTGAQTPGVELSPGAWSAITPEAHAARMRGERIEPIKVLPPPSIRRRSERDKARAIAMEKRRSGTGKVAE